MGLLEVLNILEQREKLKQANAKREVAEETGQKRQRLVGTIESIERTEDFLPIMYLMCLTVPVAWIPYLSMQVLVSFRRT